MPAGTLLSDVLALRRVAALVHAHASPAVNFAVVEGGLYELLRGLFEPCLLPSRAGPSSSRGGRYLYREAWICCFAIVCAVPACL